MRVRDVMTAELVTVAPDASVRQAVRRMIDRRVSGLPVVDGDGRLVGIVTEGDFLDREADRSPWSEEIPRGDGVLVGQVMTRDVVTVPPDVELAEAARAMRRHRVKRLPVVGEDGRLLGIVSRADMLRAFVRPDAEVEQEIVESLVRQLLQLDSERVAVEVREGEVTLTGAVPTRFEAVLLERMTRRIDGVVKVSSRLRWPGSHPPTYRSTTF